MSVHGIIIVMLEINLTESVPILEYNKYPTALCHNVATVHTGNGILRHY